jgi:hypothetical protein
MSGGAIIVDSTYRWVLVCILAVAFVISLMGQYRIGFNTRDPLRALVYGALIAVASALFSPIFGDSIVDALLLRANFGFIVPDEQPHGFAWGLIFGYSWVLANAAILAIGRVMVAFGRVPPWVKAQESTDKRGKGAT